MLFLVTPARLASVSALREVVDGLSKTSRSVGIEGLYTRGGRFMGGGSSHSGSVGTLSGSCPVGGAGH